MGVGAGQGHGAFLIGGIREPPYADRGGLKMTLVSCWQVCNQR
jgi:hypothetical protein